MKKKKRMILFSVVFLAAFFSMGQAWNAAMWGNITKQLIFNDGTSRHIIKSVQEPGFDGGQLRFGLDGANSVIVICNVDDIDTDFDLTSATPGPKIWVTDDDANKFVFMGWDGGNLFELNVSNLSGPGSLYFDSEVDEYHRVKQRFFIRTTDNYTLANKGIFRTDYSGDTGFGLAGEDVLQYWVTHNANVVQSGTSSAYIIRANMVTTSLGDGSSGDGYNLLWLGVDDVAKFRVDHEARLVLAESSTPAALADHAFLYAKDVGGTGNLFAADAAASETQLTSHNMELFDPDPDEPYPWSFYAVNRALGIKINVDMAGMVRAVEKLTGATFIHYADIPEKDRIDLEALQREQWKKKWKKQNTKQVEIPPAEAFETVEKDIVIMYETKEIDKTTGKIKKVKKPRKIGEKIVGYFLDENKGTVVAKKEPVWQTRKEPGPKLKKDIELNENTGKLYRIVVPTDEEAETAAKKDFKFEAPDWFKLRLSKK